MKIKVHRSVICFLMLLFSHVFSQNNNYIDSLKKLTISSVDSIRFNAYTFLAWELKETNTKAAFEYAAKLFEEATAVGNKKWIMRSHSDMSNIYMLKGDLNKALAYANKAVDMARISANKKDIAGALLNLSNLKSHNNDYAAALELQLKALKIYEELKKNYYISLTCNAISASYSSIGNFKLSNVYLSRSYAISKLKADFQNQGMTLGLMGDNYKSLNNIDSSIYCYNEAKILFKQIENYTDYATACINIGGAYLSNNDLKHAEEQYKEAVEISKKIENLEVHAFSEICIAGLYIKQGNYSKAEQMLLNSLELAKKLGSGETELAAYDLLTELYMQKKDPVKADLYYNEYKSLKDSVFSKEMALRFSEAQTRFDVEKKDLELAKNKAEIEAHEKQNFIKDIIIFSVIALLCLLTVVATLAYRKKQIQQQAKLDAEIASQKEIRSKAIIEAEEKERRRIAQDLHDGVGQILSAAKLNLSGLESQINLTDQKQKDAFKNALDLIDDSVKEVRIVSHNMMPNTLIKLGLASAIKEFITKIQGTPNLKVNLEIVGLDKRLDPEKETVLYRVIQEIVSNIIKHAKATEIGLQLIKHEKELSIIIGDNGVGFDTSKINTFEGIGLKNIISRIEFINGSVHFDSTITKGTTIVIEVEA
ncbi:MAG: tetratricopeptide repeat protein [Bacteroidia bacterium]